MSKIKLENVEKIIEKGFVIFGYGIITLLTLGSGRSLRPYLEVANYGEAVSVITRSRMFSDDKKKAIAVLPQNKDDEFYKAIICIANDSKMFSGDKAELIHNLCKEKS